MFFSSDILQANPGAELLRSGESDRFPGASLDSRRIKPGEIFFAVQGKDRDGHQFLAAALNSGAAGAVVSQSVNIDRSNATIVRVPDTVDALQRTASYVRLRSSTQIIAVTGSVGKTTTKDLIAHVLGSHLQVGKSPASFNNQYGVPLALLGLLPDQTHAVIELGTNHPGELAPLVSLANPDIGVVTNIGHAHIENFGTQDAIASEKRELVFALKAGKTAIINGDDPHLKPIASALRARGLNVITYGLGADNLLKAVDLAATATSLSGQVEYGGHRASWFLETPAHHFVFSGMAALAVAVSAGIDLARAADALATFTFPAGRFNVIRISPKLSIFDDTYNAGPDAMLAAIQALRSIPVKNRIVVLGEMRELGQFSDEFHRRVGKEAARIASHLITVGPGGRIIIDSAIDNGFDPRVSWSAESALDAFEIARELLQKIDEEDTLVLVKGARFTHMERVVLGLQGTLIGCRLNSCSKYIHCCECPLLRAE